MTAPAASKDAVSLLNDWGCVPSPDSDSYAAIQGGLNAILGRVTPNFNIPGISRPSVVTIDATHDGFWVSKPVVIQPTNLKIKGEGRDASRISANGHFPPLVIGPKLCTDSQPNGVSPLNRPEITDLLDGTTGRRWGYKPVAGLLADGTADPALTVTATFSGTAFDLGPCMPAQPNMGPCPDLFEQSPDVTWELALHIPAAPPASGYHLMGYGGNTDVPDPLYVWLQVEGNQLHWWVKLKTGKGADVSFEFFSPFHPDPGKAGVHRLAICIALSKGRAWAFGDKLQVFSGAICDPGQTWQRSGLLPFTLGTAGVGYGSGPATWLKRGLTFCGLRYSKGALYQDQGPGKPQASTDGTTGDALSDNACYFSAASTTAAWLDFGDPPSTDAKPLDGNRWLRIVHGPAAAGLAYSFGYLACPDALNGGASCQLADFTAQCMGPYGSGITLGWAEDLEATSVFARGGAFGWGTMPPAGASYPIRSSNCQGQGTVASMFALNQLGDHRAYQVGYTGLYALVLYGCSETYEFSVTGDRQRTISFGLIRQTGYAGNLTVRDLCIDYEYMAPWPSEAMWRIELASVIASNVTFERVGGGMQGRSDSADPATGSPWLLLEDHGVQAPAGDIKAGWPWGNVRIAGLGLGDGSCTAVVRVSSPIWHVLIEDSWLPRDCPSVDVRTPDGRHNCKVVHPGYCGYPNDPDKHWVATVDWVENRGARPGEPLWYYCVKSGKGNDARFVGLDFVPHPTPPVGLPAGQASHP